MSTSILPFVLDCPPLLFETKSGSECGVSFGGAPTVYLHNGVPSADSLFHVRSLASGELVRTYLCVTLFLISVTHLKNDTPAQAKLPPQSR